jgi:hypothetical protein
VQNPFTGQPTPPDLTSLWKVEAKMGVGEKDAEQFRKQVCSEYNMRAGEAYTKLLFGIRDTLYDPSNYSTRDSGHVNYAKWFLHKFEEHRSKAIAAARDGQFIPNEDIYCSVVAEMCKRSLSMREHPVKLEVLAPWSHTHSRDMYEPYSLGLVLTGEWSSGAPPILNPVKVR